MRDESVSSIYILLFLCAFLSSNCHNQAQNLMIAFTCADGLLSEVTVSVRKVVWKSLDMWQPSVSKHLPLGDSSPLQIWRSAKTSGYVSH
jgi:hypothetical protein